MVYTAEQIEWEVSQISGTWIKRRNLRNKLTEKSNSEINERIERIKQEVRGLKLSGVREQALSPIYAKITQLEIRLL